MTGPVFRQRGHEAGTSTIRSYMGRRCDSQRVVVQRISSNASWAANPLRQVIDPRAGTERGPLEPRSAGS